ncbi:hypothetical protein ACFIQG_21960, partial [Comamonas odontotermitis]|uniref:hypothetical protein n=1 Tax=Comamonas odontotermitis TaxID=379895 RepID=UPI0036707772
QRSGWQKAVVALANKNARILWALMVRECPNFCVRGALRFFHGGGRHFRGSGKTSLHSTWQSW